MMHKSRASLFTLLLVGALGLIFLTTGLAFAAPPAGTISYWKLDEIVAGVPGVADAYEDVINAPDGNNGEVPAAPKTAPLPNLAGIVGGAQDFDGVADAIDVPDPVDGSFDFALADSFTIECWIKSAKVFGGADISQVFVGRDDFFVSGMQWWLGMEGDGGPTAPGNVTFFLIDTDGVDTTLAPAVPVLINDDAWYHVVAIYDGGAVSLYVNGVKVDEDLATVFTGDFAAPGGADLNLGWLNIVGDYHYAGTLDEVALYSRALTLAEIIEHYTNGLAGNGVDYVAPVVPATPSSGGGGGGGGCFIGTTVGR